MADKDFGELLKGLGLSKEGPANAETIVDLLKGLGVSPEHPEQVKDAFKKIGFNPGTLEDQEDIKKMINLMTSHLGPDAREKISQIVEQSIQNLGCDALPEDILKFLEEWKNS